jgi:hypothetical protein
VIYSEYVPVVKCDIKSNSIARFIDHSLHEFCSQSLMYLYIFVLQTQLLMVNDIIQHVYLDYYIKEEKMLSMTEFTYERT